LPWLFFNKIVAEGVDALNANLDILKQAVFPVEIISVISATENLVNLLLQLCLLAVCVLFSEYHLTWRLLCLPLYLILLYFFSLGMAWILSIIGFFVRDFKEVLTGLLGFMVYFTPVMYDKSNVPEKLWIVFMINPMTHAINVFRDIIMYPVMQSPTSWFVFFVFSLLTGILGYVAILSVKKSVGDLV
jgi:ABC-type polysaccharide/polyol phosphate export permease